MESSGSYECNRANENYHSRLQNPLPAFRLIVNDNRVTLVRIYPDLDNPSRSTTQVSFYYTQEAIDRANAH